MARQTATSDFFGCVALLLSADNNGSDETDLSYSVSRLAFTRPGSASLLQPGTCCIERCCHCCIVRGNGMLRRAAPLTRRSQTMCGKLRCIQSNQRAPPLDYEVDRPRR
jgi:hypothetical protein